jgi:flavin reductase (DIM6/NTAB) family NADH-FMN oxidoreductase RutF
MIEEKRFRSVLGHFPTGVTVVTTLGEGGVPVGLTVSAFLSVSLDPPLVLVSIHRDAAAHDLLSEEASFAVCVLSSKQEELAVRFASWDSEERFNDLVLEHTPLGNPLLPDVIAWFDCRVTEVFPGGDHSVVVASVNECHARGGDPLIFHRGGLRGLRP